MEKSYIQTPSATNGGHPFNKTTQQSGLKLLSTYITFTTKERPNENPFPCLN